MLNQQLIQHFAPMGIEGMLKLLESIVLKEHISSFHDKTAAIDMMSWLYKGCYRCAFELNQNIESNEFLYFIFEMLDLLSYYRIKPICVFDGRYVGKKEDTLEKRKKTKEQNKQRGLDYLKIGNKEEARKYLSRCIIIDQRIITTTMRALHTKGVQYMVAPYQSDSQIAKLIQVGHADFAISEDSDLMAYGVPAVLKLIQDGQCDFLDLKLWTPDDVQSPFVKAFLGMSHQGRIEAAVLAGNDYNSSVLGIGIKKAIKHLTLKKGMNQVVKHLRQTKPFCDRVPENYEKTILTSKLIFCLATTYNPLTNSLEFLNTQFLEQLKPEDMSMQGLLEVVGPHYEYDENMRLGRVNVKNKNPREITVFDIKSSFSISPANLELKEVLCRQRRKQDAIMREQKKEERMQLIASGKMEEPSFKPKQRKKKEVAPPPPPLTEEEKKKLSQMRKEERIRRFAEFKQLLNSFMDDYNEEDDRVSESQSSVESMESEDEQMMGQKRENSTAQKIYQEEDSREEEKEVPPPDINLNVLNPWAKKTMAHAEDDSDMNLNGLNPWAKSAAE